MSNAVLKNRPRRWSRAAVRLEGDNLLLSFRFEPSRVKQLQSLGRVAYSKELKAWIVPKELLPRLEALPKFKPASLSYGFDRTAVLGDIAARSDARAKARAALDPFRASEAQIADAQPDICFRRGRDGSGIVASGDWTTELGRIVAECPGAVRAGSGGELFVPTEELVALLKRCRGVSGFFVVEEGLAEALGKAPALRAKILSGEHAPSSDELAATELVPHVRSAGKLHSGRLELHGATAGHWRGYGRPPQGAKRFMPSEIVTILESALAHGQALWLPRELREQIVHAEADVDDARLAALRAVLDGRAALFEGRASPIRDPFLLFGPDAIEAHVGGERAKGRHVPWAAPRSYLYRLAATEVAPLLAALKKAGIPVVRSAGAVRRLELLSARAERREEQRAWSRRTDCELDHPREGLAEKLFPHQRVAVEWLARNAEGWLADEMGLGKTISVLAAYDLLRNRRQIERLLVVCPVSLVRSWLRELEVWLPDIVGSSLPDTPKPRREFLADLVEHGTQRDVIVVNFETLRIEEVAIALKRWSAMKRTLLCVDESQRAKNSRSVTWRALATVAEAAARRVLLSGTPFPKDLSDVWAQMFLLDRGARLGEDYYRWLEGVAELGNEYSAVAVRRFLPIGIEATQAHVHEVMLRRRKEDVLTLPPKLFSVRDVPLEGEQKRRYEEACNELRVQIRTASGAAFERDLESILERFLRAVQLASNPRLVDTEFQGEPAKFLELDQILDEIVADGGRKVVVWTNYRRNVDELVARYAHLGSVPFHGDVSPKDRADTIRRFQTGEDLKVLVAIPAAGGVGITLTAASTAIYLDKTWNAEHWLQSIDRIHRIGQRSSVHVVSLHACKVDWLIHTNLVRKSRMQSMLVGDDDDRDRGAGLSRPRRAELLAALERER